LSDDELLRTEFRIDDPENIEGLNRGVPDQEAHPAIIGYYDVTPAGGRARNPNFPFIRCCHCGLRRHWKGHVVRDDRDQLYIIGASRCGREHYGARYEAAERAFREEQARKAALLRWRNMLALAAPMPGELDEIFRSTGLAALELKRDAIRRASPDGFRRLQQVAEPGNPLVEVREERDHAAEAERQARYERALAAYQAKPSEARRRLRDEGLRPEPETTPIYRRESLPLGNVQGGSFLTDSGDVRAAALALRETLAAVHAVQATGTQGATSTELKRLLREMTDRPRALYHALHGASFAPLFFHPDNLERLERWSAGQRRWSFHRGESALIVQDSAKGRSEIGALAHEQAQLPASPTFMYIEYYDEQFLPMMADAA
jgi:hypothetical protein